MIKIENLNFKFDNETIFKDAVIEILNNRLTVITGTNGAGKSTLLKIITKNIRTNCKIQNAFKNIFYLRKILIIQKISQLLITFHPYFTKITGNGF